MGYLMTNFQFVEKIKSVKNYKTKYCWGMFGHVLNDKLIDAKKAQYPTFYKASKVAELKTLDGYFGIDCVGLIKAILWGWNGNKDKTYGGATYSSNGVPDIDANQMYKLTNQSTDFKNIEVGEVVWKVGHIGVYIGNGIVAEMTNSWTQNFQFTALGNIRPIEGLNSRSWTGHGRLPWISYVKPEPVDEIKELVDSVSELGGIISASAYWVKVIKGEVVANPDYVKSLFENIVEKFKDVK